MEAKGTVFKNRYSMTQTHVESGPNGENSPQKNERARFKN